MEWASEAFPSEVEREVFLTAEPFTSRRAQAICLKRARLFE